jgi:chemosensory pili system protein ChpB (putative protein-glutamate methylesterase)
MPDQTATEAVPRVVLLARAGKAADNLADAVRQAGAELVMTADPAHTDEAALRAQRPQAVLVALEPSIENALDKLDGLLVDPSLTVIFDEADLAASRTGWDAARWVRHLSAKLRHDTNVLPPGTESDHDWQPSPGQIPKPAAAYADVDMAMFAQEALASADSVPSDGMPAESFVASPAVEEDRLDVYSTSAQELPVAPPATLPPPLPPAAFEIESFEAISFESNDPASGTFEAGSFESATSDSSAFDLSSSIDSGIRFETAGDSAPFERTQFESMHFESAADSALGSVSAESAAGNIAPMNLDDDAFFLEELSVSESVAINGDQAAGMQFDVGFDADTDFEAESDLRSTVSSPGSQRETEDVMSFEALIASSIAAAEELPGAARPSPEPTLEAEAPPRVFSLGDLSLAPVDDAPVSPASSAESKAAPFTHDISALEARISSLSLVDMEGGGAADPSTPFGSVEPIGVVLVEAGLGGPDPARQLLAAIPAEFPAIVLVRLHLQGGRYDRLVAQMERAAALPVALAESGGNASPGTIYFLPDGIGLAARGGSFSFIADASPTSAGLFAALPSGESAVVFLSGSDPQLVETAMAVTATGSMLIAQSPEDCYDGAACAELRTRGVVSGLPAELAGRLSSRWPS